MADVPDIAGRAVPTDDSVLTDALRRWLERHAVALVGLVDHHGQLLPWPDSVPLGPGHRVDDRSLLDLVVDSDRTRLTTAFLDAIDQGVATTTVRMASTSDAPVSVHYFDLRHELGGLVRLCRPADDGEGGDSGELHPAEPARPRMATITKGANGVITGVDDDFVRLLGWPPENVIGRRSLTIIHPDDQSKAVDNWMRMVADGARHTVRLRHLRADGSWLWLETANEPLDPAATRVRCHVVDVSEEMQAVDALRQREELLRRVTEAVPVGLAHLAPDGAVAFANTALLRLLGQPALDRVDDLLAALPHDVAATLAATLRAVMATGHDADVDLMTAGSAHGAPSRCKATLSAIHDDGAVVGVLVCMVDVTELANQATRDGLTGTLNRSSVLAALDAALSATDHTVGVAFVDLDGFKGVNDSLGHAAGDELLRRVAAGITSAVRGGDVVGRIGGDEFLAVFPAVSGRQELELIARRIRRQIARCGAAASVGIELAAAGTPAATLVEQADQAMYRAKRRALARAE